MKALQYLRNIIWILLITTSSYPVIAANAPVTTASIKTGCPGTTVTVPVTVVNFTNIMSVTLRIEYDSAVMRFNRSACFSNPALSGVFFDNVHDVGGSICRIMIVWADVNPVTLDAGSTMITLGFNYLSGTTALSFNNESGSGEDCEYADASLQPMTDTPTASFYHNGQVSSAALAGSVAGGGTIYFGSSTGNLTISGFSGSVVKWQKQYNGEGYADISATTGLTVYSETPAYTGTWNYRAVVQNSPCAEVNSDPAHVTVLTPVGTSKTWTGTAGTSWKDPTNWSPPGTPDLTDNVIIPATPNLPVVINTVVGCNDLFISKNASLTVGTAKSINVAGTLTIEGP